MGGLCELFPCFPMRRILLRPPENLKIFAVMKCHVKTRQLRRRTSEKTCTRDTKRNLSLSNKHSASCTQRWTYSTSEIDTVSPAGSVARPLNHFHHSRYPFLLFTNNIIITYKYILSRLVRLRIDWKLAILFLEHCSTLVYNY